MEEKKSGKIFTVSKLTRQIKILLEEAYPFVWITGEISNYALPASGHSYFTLKDDTAVINSVMFKSQKRQLKFNLENGLKVFGLARVSLYEPRGSYQLIFEHLEPDGTGSLQLAFEQLKDKLRAKGYFDEKHKKSIPFLSSAVSVITSPTGAAVKDIINIVKRRYPNCCLNIYPVKVQGDDSIDQICQAIELANIRNDSDLIILARGGGSIEDLASFNSEEVAESIFYSQIPIITGIGHETDYTIADFVADMRAPTPSAAAELSWPDKTKLLNTIRKYERDCTRLLSSKIVNSKDHLISLSSRLKSPETVIYDYRFRLEDFEKRMSSIIQHNFSYKKDKLSWLCQDLFKQKPVRLISQLRQKLKMYETQLNIQIKYIFDQAKFDHSGLCDKLETLSPKAVLKRGYSISRFYLGKELITNADAVNKEDLVEIMLDKGRLVTRVEKKNNG